MAEDLDDAVVAGAKLPPIGMTAKVRNAGTQRQVRRELEHQAVGAVRDEVLLEEELDAVGEGLQACPNGPARLGPMRFCMSPMILRSNQIMNMTATSSNTNVMSDLDQRRCNTTARPTWPTRSGSSARIMTAWAHR